jgi:hypothetical protein
VIEEARRLTPVQNQAGLKFLVHLSEGRRRALSRSGREPAGGGAAARAAHARRVLLPGGFGLAASGRGLVLGLTSEPRWPCPAHAGMNALANLDFRRGDIFALLDGLVAAGEVRPVVLVAQVCPRGSAWRTPCAHYRQSDPGPAL